MVKERYECLKAGQALRKNLIEMKQELADEAARQEFLAVLDGDYSILVGLMGDPDPKVRKNAALILGRIGQDENVAALYGAYEKEQKLFVKSDYLKALMELDCSGYREELCRRLDELERYNPAEDEQKHIREELSALRKLAGRYGERPKHRFQGYGDTWEAILTTGGQYQQITADQVEEGKVTVLKSGVRVLTGNLRQVLLIPTYRELLFTLNVKKISGGPEEAARALASSNLPDLLCRAHGAEDGFYFRMGLHSPKPLEQRGAFIKKCSYALEKETGGRLKNSPSDYELEIRLIENREGNLLPLLKLYTFAEDRFSYRKNTVAGSIRPEQAALAVRLARPYMQEQAQVLDPFCGVGTMLIERERACHAKVMYGVDIFGDAIAKAKENTELAGMEIYYIKRDFAEFTHRYLFDEIITDMPVRGQKGRDWLDAVYAVFFDRAGEMLAGKGKIFLYSGERNLVRKQLRLHKGFTLLREYSMDGKGNYYLFIICKAE